MVITQEPVIAKRHVHFNGINHVSEDDSEAGVYNAYLEFAFHHTLHDAKAYENAAANSRSSEQKNMFVQLACRKNDVADTLKTYRSDFSLMSDAERKQTAFFPAEQQQGTAPGLLTTANDAIKFVFQRENRTLELYLKLAKTARLSSIKSLLDYLIESQCHQMLYLTTQCATVGCLL